jgi:cytidine deaminase
MSSIDQLFEAAREAMALCYAPYSKFPVGAAIRAEDGKIYKGANIENLAFPQGWCAECTAIGAMVMGGQKKIVEIAVIAEKMALCPPCGGCRQKISEFADRNTRIHLCDETGIKKTMTMDELLPFSFETDTIAGSGTSDGAGSA